MSQYAPNSPQQEFQPPSQPLTRQQQQQPFPPTYQPYVPSYPNPQLPVMRPKPPKKRGIGKIVVIGCGTIAGLCVLLIVLAVTVGIGQNSSSDTSPGSSSAGQTNPQPQIGVPFVVDSTWTVTVNKVSTNQGNDVFMPKAGNTYLVADVTLQNTSSDVQHASGLLQWSLKDATTGQVYTDSLMGADPGGTVTPGGLVRGQLYYEVPRSVHNYTLQFVADLGSNDLAEWVVTM